MTVSRFCPFVTTRFLVLAVTASVVLAACGGGGSGEAPTPTTTPARATSTPAPTATIEPGHEPIPIIDVEQVAAETGCPMTPYASSRITAIGEAAIWYQSGSLRLSPTSGWGGHWYAGAMPVSWETQESGQLDITAELRDAELEPVLQSVTLFHERPPLFNRLNLPQSGCWDLTATLGEHVLAVTVFAHPLAERPDIVEYLLERPSITPYPVPADCQVTPLVGPRDDQNAPAHLAWWVEGRDLRLEGELDLLYAGNNPLRWYPSEWGGLTLTATHASDAAIEGQVDSTARRSDMNGEHWLADLFLPEPGCWHLSGAAGDQTVEATLYAYPAACRPEPGHLPPPCDPE